MTSEGKSDLTKALLDKTKITVSHIFKLMPDNLVYFPLRFLDLF